MKKLFFVALAGMMMFAFTQCGGGAFSSAKSAINSAKRAVENAKECDELTKIGEDFEKEMDEMEKKFPDYTPTSEEQEELAKLIEEYATVAMQKAAELCK